MAASFNKPINDIGKFFKKANVGDFFLGGISDTLKNVEKDGLIKGATKAHKKADGSWNGARIAGSYLTGAAGYRVLSGGGVYKDSEGNPNLIGIPGI